MKRAIDASRAFTDILAAQQGEVLGRLNDIAAALEQEMERTKKETEAMMHMVEDHGRAAVGRIQDIRSRVLRLAKAVEEGTAGPEQVADDLARQKGLEAVRSAVMPAKLDEPGGAHAITLPLAQLTPAGDGIQGEAA